MKKRFIALTALLFMSMMNAACSNTSSTSVPTTTPPASTSRPQSNDSTAAKVAVTSVEISAAKTSLTVGESLSLTTTVLPINATDKSVTYKSSDEKVLTVNASGLVTAKALGAATITATTNDGNKTDTIDFIVAASTIFEAENADLTPGTSGAILINDTEGASGGKTLGNCFNNTGASISFEVSASKAGSYELYASIAFGSSHTDNPLEKVVVNGKDVEVPQGFDDPKADWNHYEEFYLASVDLNAGKNTIALIIDQGLGNLDYIKLVGQGELTEAPKEASIAITAARSKYIVGVKAALNVTLTEIDATKLSVTSSDDTVIPNTVSYDDAVKQILFTPIKAGSAKITLTDGKVTSSVDINAVEDTGTEYTFRGVDATLSSCHPIDESNAEGQVVGGIWDNSAVITYKINSEVSQRVSLIFRTAVFDNTRTALSSNFSAIKVNGTSLDLSNIFIESSEGVGTSKYGIFYLYDVDLVAGSNTIVLEASSSGRTNFDYMKVRASSPVIAEEESETENDGYRFEAEYASLTNCNEEAQVLASGGYCIGGIGDTSIVTYSLSSETDQSVELDLITAVIDASRNKVGDYIKSVTVNDAILTIDAEKAIEYEGTPTWTCFAPITLEDVELKEGVNTIAIAFNGTTCFDYIEVFSSTESLVEWQYDETVESKLEGEDATLTNCAAVSEEDGASNGMHVGQISTGSIIEYQVDSAASQFVTLVLRSAIVGEDRIDFSKNFKSVEVNGQALAIDGTADFETGTNYGWGNYSDFAIRGVRLNKGSNVITLRLADGAMTNFDYLLLKGSATVSLHVEEEVDINPVEGESYIYEPAEGTKDLGAYEGAYNGDAIGSVNYNGCSLTIKVNAPSAIKVSAYINTAYSNGKSPVTSLKVNGVEATELVADIKKNDGWDTFERNFIGNISLVEGENTIELAIGLNCGKFDYLELVSPVELN